MRSQEEERTNRAVIRDEALRLFADRGFDAVSLRDIAAAAHISPALIIRHFGSKEGLRKEVDRHVLATLDAMFAELTRHESLYDPAASASIAAALVGFLPHGSPIPRYLSRLLLDASGAGRRLFRRLFKIGEKTLGALAASGLADSGADPRVRAAFLTANDLAVLLLRDQIAATLGFDPLSREGLVRWSGEVMAVYSSGLRRNVQKDAGRGNSSSKKELQ